MSKYIKLFQNHDEYEDFVDSGTMMKPNVSHCVRENEVHYNPFSWDEEYLTFAAKEDGTFQLSTNAVNYSLDNGETWTELAAGTATPTVTAGNKIMWKGELTPSSSNGIGTFSSTGQFDTQGNVMSLLYGDDFKGQTDLTNKGYAFKNLFSRNNVLNAKNLMLPAITLADDCYYNMFGNCTSLVTAPELPATTLASSCYESMFYGCTSLTTAPELPATSLTDSCYKSMFYGCTNLATAPALPATTLKYACYDGMFQGCTSLTTAPELPATTLVSYCYNNMFAGCTSLTTAPELPALNLVSYCYSNMFNGCTNLNYIKAMFTTTPSGSSPNYYTQNWVKGVAASGTFVKNSAATWTTRGVHGIPNGWTVQNAS